ncbi:hypothetical protein R3P38DRAFT_3209267 [Favolaschia claudopus]|uniref:Uncharacterized protein n=1 Tax=Favolaschia claudopus TaxID=2862362 RepID=A0AAW0AIQ7_9AGAR
MPFIAAAVINKVLPAINSAVTEGNGSAPLTALHPSSTSPADNASRVQTTVVNAEATGVTSSDRGEAAPVVVSPLGAASDGSGSLPQVRASEVKSRSANTKEEPMKKVEDGSGASGASKVEPDGHPAVVGAVNAKSAVGDKGKGPALRGPSAALIPPAKCEVNDETLQDDAIKDIYVDLPPLRGGKAVLPSFDPNPEELDGAIGGRLSFSIWETILCHATASTLLNAMVFTRTGRYFVNPSRVSPSLMTLKQTVMGAPGTHRLSVGNHAAICVSAGMCTASHILEPVQSGGTPPRYRKYIDLLMHNQDWERWVAFMCICFGYNVLRATITSKAVSMTTRLGQADVATQAALSKISKKPIFSYFKSPTKGQSSTANNVSAAYPTSYSLKFDDTIYDARDREIDFDVALPSLDASLPKWTGGEIPIASFVVVGYSVASYMGKAQGVEGRTMHVGSNILWVILCGTPDPDVLDSPNPELDMDED